VQHAGARRCASVWAGTRRLAMVGQSSDGGPCLAGIAVDPKIDTALNVCSCIVAQILVSRQKTCMIGGSMVDVACHYALHARLLLLGSNA
jgi:hypothetical protein